MHQAKLWTTQVLNWLKWRKIYNRHIYLTPQSCAATHSHLKTGQASIWTADRLYRSPLCFRKAASKSRPLKCSLFWIWNLVVYEKSNLLTWAIRLIFSDPVIYISNNTRIHTQYCTWHKETFYNNCIILLCLLAIVFFLQSIYWGEICSVRNGPLQSCHCRAESDISLQILLVFHSTAFWQQNPINNIIDPVVFELIINLKLSQLIQN